MGTKCTLCISISITHALGSFTDFVLIPPLFFPLCIVKHKFVSDSRSVNLKNNRGNIQRKAGKALYNVAESLPGDWQTFSDNNIREYIKCVKKKVSTGLRPRSLVDSSIIHSHSFLADLLRSIH